MPKNPRSRVATALVSLGAAAALLTGCGGAGAPGAATGAAAGEDDRPVVLTTFTVLADIARNVAGDRLDVRSITKAGADSTLAFRAMNSGSSGGRSIAYLTV